MVECVESGQLALLEGAVLEAVVLLIVRFCINVHESYGQ
jgi:hypothetical protein